MTAQSKEELTLTSGDDWVFPLQLLDGEQAPVDLTNYGLDESKIIWPDSDGLELAVVAESERAEGKWTLKLRSEDTPNVPIGRTAKLVVRVTQPGDESEGDLKTLAVVPLNVLSVL